MTEDDIAEPQEEEEIEDWKDKYLRLLADSENTRKRMQKERQELTKYAIENVIAEFLHPLDSFAQALGFAEQTSDEVKHWALGFEMILGQFKQILSNHGVEPYTSKGEHFDPHWHEAVEMQETTEYPPGTVVEECIPGYRMGDRVIRVARVKVSKAPQINEEEGRDHGKEEQ